MTKCVYWEKWVGNTVRPGVGRTVIYTDLYCLESIPIYRINEITHGDQCLLIYTDNDNIHPQSVDYVKFGDFPKSPKDLEDITEETEYYDEYLDVYHINRRIFVSEDRGFPKTLPTRMLTDIIKDVENQMVGMPISEVTLEWAKLKISAEASESCQKCVLLNCNWSEKSGHIIDVTFDDNTFKEICHIL